MLVYELLDNGESLAFEVGSILRQNLLQFCQKVRFHIFISVALKDIARKFYSIVTRSMDKMTEVSAGASSWAMEISAGDGSVV